MLAVDPAGSRTQAVEASAANLVPMGCGPWAGASRQVHLERASVLTPGRPQARTSLQPGHPFASLQPMHVAQVCASRWQPLSSDGGLPSRASVARCNTDTGCTLSSRSAGRLEQPDAGLPPVWRGRWRQGTRRLRASHLCSRAGRAAALVLSAQSSHGRHAALRPRSVCTCEGIRLLTRAYARLLATDRAVSSSATHRVSAAVCASKHAAASIAAAAVTRTRNWVGMRDSNPLVPSDAPECGTR